MNLLKTIAISILFSMSSVSASEWKTDIKSNNPIVGKILDNTHQRFITQQQLLNDMAEIDWILLGENHETDLHHALQTEILDLLAQENRLGNVGFEMANIEQQPALDSALG